MKQFLSILFFSLSVCHSQTYDWVRTEKEKYNTFGQQLEIDSKGNIYVASHFDYGPSKFPPDDGEGFFVSKYAPDGTLLWRKTWFQFLVDICIDPNDQLVVTYKDLTGNGYYYARYSPSGFLLQIQSLLPMSAKAMIYSHAIDPYGNHYLTGFFQDTISMGTHSLYGSGLNQLFYAKLDGADNCQWLKTTDNLCTSDAIVHLDPQGGFYLTGSFQETLVLNTVSITATDWWGDGFIGKFDQNGNMYWFKRLNNNSTQFPGYMIFDQSGNIYMTSSYFKTLSIPGTTFTPAPSEFNIYLMKMDAQANPIWLKSLHSMNGDYSSGICLAPNGEIYLSGNFDEELIIDKYDTIFSPASTASGYLPATESFLAKFKNDGTLFWTLQSGIHHGTNGGAGQIAYNGGSIFMTGWMSGTADFGKAGPVTATGSHMFLAKIGDDALVGGLELTPDQDLLYPNPFNDRLYLQTDDKDQRVCIYDVEGKCVFSVLTTSTGQRLDVGSLEAGIYFLRIEGKGESRTKKLVKMQ